MVITARRSDAQSHPAAVAAVDSGQARERANFRLLLTSAVPRNIVEAATAMPNAKSIMPLERTISSVNARFVAIDLPGSGAGAVRHRWRV